MGRADALGFLGTAFAVLVTNAILAVAIGCSFYVARYLYRRYKAAGLGGGSPATAGGMVVSDAR
jgi:hypothetical protein